MRLRCWPRSLVGRVYALYALTLSGFVVGGLALFYRYEFALELERTMQRSEALSVVVASTVSDAAVIGDYDTIRRTLERALYRSDFASAAFIDLRGGAVRAQQSDAPDVRPPQWLRDVVAERLYDTNLPIVVGGRDYGVLRLQFAEDRLAGVLWRSARVALLLAAVGLATGLLLIRWPLKRWLGGLDRIESMGDDLSHGRMPAAALIQDDTPLELRRTFDVLNQTAANLRALRERAEVTLTAIDDAVFTLDPDGRIVLANPAAAKLTGCAPDALAGRNLREVLPAVMPGNGPVHPWRNRPTRLTTAGAAQPRYVDSTLSEILAPDGSVLGHVLACRDISDTLALNLRLQEEMKVREAAIAALRKILEELLPTASIRGEASRGDIDAVSRMITQLVSRLQEHTEQLNAIFALSADGFVSFDTSGIVNFVSRGFTLITGLDDTEVLGLTEEEFRTQLGAVCPGGTEALPRFDDMRRTAGATPPTPHRRLLVELGRPVRRTVEFSLRVGQGSAIGQVLHLRDVTPETEVDRMKSEFLSTAAHELRTPMTSIYGFTELMMRRKLSPERQQEVIATVYRQTGIMISIVNELLDLARIEARRGKDFQIETVDVGALVGEVLGDFRPPDERAAPTLHAPEATLLSRLDRGKFGQALRNVLSNAYKYSPEGGTVAVTLAEAEGPAGPEIGILVRDHGIGMTPEQLARVCERFYRADESGTIPGTGLGMSIVKEIVELLGGRLSLESTPGLGTTVTLWLPRQQRIAAEASAARQPEAA